MQIWAILKEILRKKTALYFKELWIRICEIWNEIIFENLINCKKNFRVCRSFIEADQDELRINCPWGNLNFFRTKRSFSKELLIKDVGLNWIQLWILFRQLQEQKSSNVIRWSDQDEIKNHLANLVAAFVKGMCFISWSLFGKKVSCFFIWEWNLNFFFFSSSCLGT